MMILNKYLVYCMKMYEIYYHQFRLVTHEPIQSLDYEQREERELKLRKTIEMGILRLYEHEDGVHIVDNYETLMKVYAFIPEDVLEKYGFKDLSPYYGIN